MFLSVKLFFRLLRLTLLPPWPTGPRTAKRFGLLLLLVPLFLLLQAFHWIGFLLDEVLFRAYKQVEVREPLFIVGLPRSGTTFLHRVFSKDTDRFTTTRLWELLFAPSVTERKLWLGIGGLNRALGKPFTRLGRWGEKAGLGWLDVIHEVSLDDPEEDYFLLLPVFACFLLVVPFPYHEAVWRLSRFDLLPERERGPILAFYKSALQRHLFVAGPGRQLLSKNPSFTPFIRSLRTTFPDGKILCCVREPAEVVPSLLSSVREGAELFGYDVAEPRIRDRFVGMLEFFSKHALSILAEVPEDEHAFVPLNEMRKDVEKFVLGVYERFGWEAEEGFQERLKEDSQRGKDYKSRHSYSLEEFGLAEKEISLRFSDLNARFGFGGGHQ
ncbi:MAG: sulfotransferase [Gemmatimonadetes bacterium]|nr:sulfotransferase [Gemmatimonadota bacterium]